MQYILSQEEFNSLSKNKDNEVLLSTISYLFNVIVDKKERDDFCNELAWESHQEGSMKLAVHKRLLLYPI